MARFEVPIMVHPQTYDVEQRVEAVKIAKMHGMGVTMLIGAFKTRYFATDNIPVGKILVKCISSIDHDYEELCTLDFPEQNFELPDLQELKGM